MWQPIKDYLYKNVENESSMAEKEPESFFILNQLDTSLMDHLMRAFAIAFAILSGSYSSFRNVSGVSESIPDQPFLFTCCSSDGTKSDRERQIELDDEVQSVKYNYNLMHLIYCCASLYMMMTLTNWYEPETIKPKEIYNSSALSSGGGVEEIANGSFAIFWMKSGTAFFCQFLFLVIVFGRLCLNRKCANCKWFQNATAYAVTEAPERRPIPRSSPVTNDSVMINTHSTWTEPVTEQPREQ